jgi:hypothetical protein
MISVSRYRRDISLCVTAVWTPLVKLQSPGAEGVVMVKAFEV